jgi:predicted transcriptional regulator
VARKPSSLLTEVEQHLMEVLWKRGRATVAEVLDGLSKKPKPAFNTVQTTLRILEQKGFVGHEESGRAFVYKPLIDKASASRAAIQSVVSRFFDGSAGMLAVNLVESDALSAADLARIERMIAEAKRR